ncbi:hypothetical protein GCM10027451_19910 [Geodermatophilus aquaeductus]|uniref:Uncharacterized protein n=1 Tax=Geodermatophilus aquaeductus TaxID=1564161 RepID=A0A521EB26_9ACTN|nr:hypothetical protein [Geodermatophilus aquaeductus]SMO81148.1 hypothetical protein SAMN06273567_104403 [Geodermatophilus aquaeductus]
MTALEDAATSVVRCRSGRPGPSASVVLHPDRLEVHLPCGEAAPASLLAAGGLVLDLGAALARAGWRSVVERPVESGGPLAVLRPVPGLPDLFLAALPPALPDEGADDRTLDVSADDVRQLAVTAAGDGIQTTCTAGRPTSLVLSADKDDPHAWVRIGEALQRLTRTAAGRGTTVHPSLPREGRPPIRLPVRLCRRVCH